MPGPRYRVPSLRSVQEGEGEICRTTAADFLVLLTIMRKNKGAPERIRISDQRFRKALLYPAELRGLIETVSVTYGCRGSRFSGLSGGPLPYCYRKSVHR